MRKALIPLMISLIAYTFSSCKYYAPVPENSQDDNTYNEEFYNEIGKGRWIWDDSEGEECGLKVIDCFMNKDSETLKDLFCNYVKNTHDLDSEIDEAFGVIKEDIVSCGKFRIGSSDSFDEGVRVYADTSCTVPIKTSDDEEFEICIFSCIENIEKPNLVGLKMVSIYSDDTLIYTVGEREIIYY